MTLYTDYLEQIETRKANGLHPKPIEDAALVEVLIEQIIDQGHEHRASSLDFFIYNTLPGTTSAAGVKAKFLKKVVLGEASVSDATAPAQKNRASAAHRLPSDSGLSPPAHHVREGDNSPSSS